MMRWWGLQGSCVVDVLLVGRDLMCFYLLIGISAGTASCTQVMVGESPIEFILWGQNRLRKCCSGEVW